MSVGTGSESAIAEALLAHLGLRRYFDAVGGGRSRTASQTCA
ncbi:fructose-1-phosphatase [Salmonella enterica subsp. enterica]|uniref:Fructose-1-phosphatase n=1 Tax=Salmonella enterica I TaxID=59201 RepID=A0A3S4LV98_SALET|nr:fructose-1-phosphatase [Salmonella enterica subsp. enterica]